MSIKYIGKNNTGSYMIYREDGDNKTNLNIVLNRLYNVVYNENDKLISIKAIIKDINPNNITIIIDSKSKIISIENVLYIGIKTDKKKKSGTIENGYYENGLFYRDEDNTNLIVPSEGILYIDNVSNMILKYDKTDGRYEEVGGNISSSIDIAKLGPYLYYVENPKVDYEIGNKFANKFKAKNALCSSVKNAGMYGRNLDWYYDEEADFVVHTNATTTRHEVLGMCSTIPYLTQEYVDSGKWSSNYLRLPFDLVDGINDQGVVCNTNVVPTIDRTIRTNITGKSGDTVCAYMLCRYILDRANSADHAIDIINNLNLFAPANDLMDQEFHFMIGDINNAYVVEFIDNEVVVIGTDSKPFVNNKPIMTNFYLNEFTGEKATAGLHANGLERYEILSAGFDSAVSTDAMAELMRSVYYTHTYKLDTEPLWYSEYNGDYTKDGYKDITINSPIEDYDILLQRGKYEYEHRTRATSGEGSGTWQTVHSAIYDIENLALYLYSQEGTTPFVFSIKK